MSKNYSPSRYFGGIYCTNSRFVNNAALKVIHFLMLLLLVTSFASAQISGNFNFENSMQGWTTVGYGEFAQTSSSACGVGNSIRANVYYNNTNSLVSPSIGIGTGIPITMTFNYKVLDYESLAGATGTQVDVKAQWSNSVTGPWTTFFTLNALSHTVSTTCATKTVTFTPLAGPLYVRLQNKAVGADADIYYYYDNISFTEGGSATCAPPNTIVVQAASVTSNSFNISWIAPNVAPSLGYEYEVRTSGVAGSGPIGLAATGTKEAGITTADITGLIPDTFYTIFVRSKCSINDNSSWSSSAPRSTLCLATNIPYTMPLNAAVVPNSPNCVTIENVNTDDRYWKTANSTVGIVGKVIQYNYNYAMPADDWFFTPTLNFIAGTSYRIAFKYKVASYQEKLKVAIGSIPAADAMNTTLLELTIPSTTSGALQQFIDFTVPSDGEYSVGFQAYSNADSNILYIGEISVNFGPTCIPPTSPIVTNVSKTSATLGWTAATIFPENGYEYEIRTSGAAASGEIGLAASGEVPAGETTLNIENLAPETVYRIYIASKCAGQDRSTWTNGVRINTLCDFLELEQTDDIICQGSTATLQVAEVGEDINWYLSQDSNEIIFTGTTYTTPELQSTTSYFAQAKIVEANQIVKIGNGDQVTQSYQNPFYSVWSNNHTQHIIPAQELRNQGMIAGPLNSIALSVTNAGTLPMLGLKIKIGISDEIELTEFIDNSTFSTVFTSASYMPTLGENIFQFSEPFYWDGISNIVIEFCHANPAATPTMNRGVLADDTEYKSSIKANFFTATAAELVCANTSNNVSTYNTRPLFTFTGTILCQNPQRTEVVAVVNLVEPISAESTQIISVAAFEDATLANLEPNGNDILWFSNLEDALAISNQLPINTQLQSNTTYFAVRMSNGCYSTPFEIIVSVQLGMQEDSLENLRFYPNPVTEQMTISNGQEILSVKVYNMIGQEVLRYAPFATTFVVDLSKLSTGNYLVHLSTIDAFKTIKIVKK